MVGMLLTVGLSGCMQEGANRPPEAQQAIRLYDTVWQRLKQDYLHPDMNHQDWERWRHRYDAFVMTQEDAYVAIDTMIASLGDPYTRFLTPKQVTEQSQSIAAELFGVGIQVSKRQGRVVVVTPIEGSPAKRAGLMAGDIVLKVDNQPTDNLSVEETVSRIRGAKGTKVSITVLRHLEPSAGQAQAPEKTMKKVFTLIRDKISVQSIYTHTLPKHPQIGYIQITSFIAENTAEETLKALEKLGPKQAYIIDLRENYGGLLSEAVNIADMFLAKGLILKVNERNPMNSRDLDASPPIFTDKPIVLLTNESSASSSEIFAGALKDNQRAILVGQTTFGKGIVQRIETLPSETGVNITVAQYLTPNGTDIHHKGIAPHVKVDLTQARWRPLLQALKRSPDLLERAPDQYDPFIVTALETLQTQFPQAMQAP
jgi:carboxyl-terminal processing protease